MSQPDTEREAIETAASEWLAKRDRGFSPAESRAFARWRATDMRHDELVTELESVWGALDDLAAAKKQQPAGGAGVAPPAIPAMPVLAAVTKRPRPVLAQWWPALGLAAAVAVFLGVSSWRHVSSNRSDTTASAAAARYVTAVGERRKVPLSDGSELVLNTDSALTVRYSNRQRAIILERGEAFFNVSKDPARPFIVEAHGTQARAVGTAFLVRLHATETEIVVTEGRVAFGATDGAPAVVTENAQGRFSFGSKAPPHVAFLGAEVTARRVAWQSGQLEFLDTPLSDVVAEFNRYHRRQFVLGDPATEAVRVGGLFQIENVDGFMQLLDTGFGIKVVRQDAHIVVFQLRQ
jgi:transmembrane sensor